MKILNKVCLLSGIFFSIIASADTVSSSAEPLSVKSVSLNKGNACAITTDGRTYCWGLDFAVGFHYGPAPDGRLSPLTLNNKNAALVSLSNNHSCALDKDGEVYCWGLNYNGVVGVNDEYPSLNVDYPEKIDLPNNEKALAVEANNDSSLAITKSGLLCEWGMSLTAGHSIKTPTLFYGDGLVENQKVKKISMRFEHACAITEDNSLYCFGKNSYGEIGIPDNYYHGYSPFKAMENVIDVAAGDYHTCAISTDNQLYCWGDNRDHKLGINSDVENARAPQKTALDNIISVSAGSNHTCAIDKDKDVYCWGSNQHGQLGHDDTESDAIYKLPLKAKFIKASEDATCAINLDDKLICWGDNTSDKLNVEGSVRRIHAPRKFADSGFIEGEEVDKFVLGSFDANLSGGYASTKQGNIFQFIQGKKASLYSADAPISSGVKKFSMHKEPVGYEDEVKYYFSAFAIGNDGKLYKLGLQKASLFNTNGTIGNKTVIDISQGSKHACAVNSDGKVFCWGYNDYGQFGIGTINQQQNQETEEPQAVAGTGLINGHKVKEISAIDNDTCALTDNYQIYCWGEAPESPQPVQIQINGIKPIMIETAWSNVYFISDTGEIYDQIIYKTISDPPPPSRRGSLDNKTAVKYVEAYSHPLVINSAGELFSWGYNNGAAALGVGHILGTSSNPQKVFNTLSAYNDGTLEDTKVVDVAVAEHSSCALSEKGIFYCWGWTNGSLLGYNSFVPPSTVKLCDTPCCKDDLYSEIGKSCSRPDAGITGTYFCSSKFPQGAVGCAEKSTAENCTNGIDDDGDHFVDEGDSDCADDPDGDPVFPEDPQDPDNPQDPSDPQDPQDPNNPDEPQDPSNPDDVSPVISFKNLTPATVVVKKKNAAITLGPKATLEDWLKEVDTSKLKPAKKKKLKFVYRVKLVYLGKPRKTTVFTVKKNNVTRKALKAGKYKVSYQVLIKLGKKNFKKSKYSKATAFAIAGKKKKR